jgi:branched-chain amino acid transport system ATP-binding protein
MTLLRTAGLKKYFGEVRAVDDVNFAVRAGEFVSLVGSNGAGKTTLINVISALLPSDGGEIYFEEREITGLSPAERIHLGIGRSFQLVNVFNDMTTFDNVCLAIFSREGKIRKLLSLAHRDTVCRQEVREVLALFGLEKAAESPAGSLAQGERKLLDVAVAFALKPKLLFLDEPTSGVSTRDKSHIMDTVSEVVRGGRITAVVVEHDMDVVFKYSDRIVAMHQGRILADGTPEEIRNNVEVATTLIGAPFAD